LQQKDREEAPTETLEQLEQWEFSTVEQALALTPDAGSMSAIAMFQQLSPRRRIRYNPGAIARTF